MGVVSGDDVARWVERARSGDEVAWGALVARFEAPVRRLARQILCDRDDAEDAAQEAWVLAYRQLGGLREPARFAAWLYQLTVRHAIRLRRRRASERARAAGLAGRVTATDRWLAQRVERLPGALEALSPKDALVTRLHHLDGLPVDRVARLLGVPPGTVKSRLHHARRRLREEVEAMAQSDIGRAPAEFRRVVHNEHGPLPWYPLLTVPEAVERFEPGRGYEPLTEADRCGWELGPGYAAAEDDADGLNLVFGETGWRDYELAMLVTPLRGGNAQVLLRVEPTGRRWYVLDLMLGWQAVAIGRAEWTDAGVELTRLSVVDHPLELEREVALTVAARGASLTSYLDGVLINQVTDETIAAGRAGLSVWHGRTLYRDLRVRLLAG